MLHSVFLGRQPVLSRQQQIIGHEFLFRGDAQASGADFNSDLEAGLSILRALLTSMNQSLLAGDRLVFINVGERILHSEFLELLPANRIVLECNIQDSPSDKLLKRLAYLRERGFNLAVDDFVEDSVANAVLPWVNYLKVALPKVDPKRSIDIDQISKISEDLRKRYHAVQIVKHIETAEQYQACLEAGFDGFQGHYFARVEKLAVQTLRPRFSHVLHLLNLLRQHADCAEIEEAFKADFMMLYKLCSISGFAPLAAPVSSIREALQTVGETTLARWMTLFLLSSHEIEEGASDLLQLAMKRAYIVAALGREMGEVGDDYFLAGMFSLLDQLLGASMADIVSKMYLSPCVQQALLMREGKLGQVLAWLEAWEKGDLLDSLEVIGLSQDRVHQIVASAQSEAERVTG